MSSIDWRIDEEASVRSFTRADAELLFGVVDGERERLARWMSFVETTRSVEDEFAFIDRCRASDVDVEGNGIWVGDDLAGGIGMSVHPLFNSGEIGYWLRERFEGRGLVTRACRLFVDHAFRNLRLHRVEIRAAVGNTRSQAVPERLGFTREAVLREAVRSSTGYHDTIVFGLLEHEWPAA